MPATPFPHPSVHTTTTVHSLTCSRIRPHSRAHVQSCWLSPVTQCHPHNKSENTSYLNQFWSSKTTESFSQMLLQVDTFENPSLTLRCGLGVKCWFMTVMWCIFESRDFLVHMFAKNISSKPMTSHKRRRCKCAGAASSGLHVAENGICKWNVDCKV